MPNCNIKTCFNHSKYKKSGFTFHRLPLNTELRQKWLDAIGVCNIKHSHWTRICSRHFTGTSFYKPSERTKLKEDAFPTLFLQEPIIKKYNVNKSNATLPTTPKRKVQKVKRNLTRQFNEESESSLERIKIEHNYCLPETKKNKPIYRKKYYELRKKLIQKQVKIKILQQKLRRRNKKVKSLHNCIEDLQRKEILSNDACSVLKNTLKGIPAELFGKLSKLQRANIKKYTPDLRKFALTLNFLSPKGYDYVRQIFGKCLPHPTTLYRWYVSVNGEPGISEEALKAIESKMLIENKPCVVAVMYDEMAIRKHIDFDGNKNIGFVNLGFQEALAENTSLPVAENALVFMVVALNSNWKVPVAYYLIKHVSAQEKKYILGLIIKKLVDINVKVASVTCDGLSSNLTMAKQLGLSLDINSFKTSLNFAGVNQDIYFILDPCHVLKLIRNALFQYKIMVDSAGNKIDVHFIVALQELQQNQGLKLCNKLSLAHIDWHKQPMKVRFAAQTLSSSVADAIDYCRDVLQLDQFKNSEGTTKFIRYIDRNIFGKHYKAPLKIQNEQFWDWFLKDAFQYIKEIKTLENNPVVESRRKTGFLGVLINLVSIKNIYDRFIKKESIMKYLLTYKMSQDHLELFFSSIRSRGGYNNNPTSKQFVAAYKRLLVHHELKHVAANCLELESCPILTVSSKTCQKKFSLLSTEAKNLQFDKLEITEREMENIYRPVISHYVDSVVEYIAGFIAKKLLINISCEICASSLTSNNLHCGLIHFKNRGGLVTPSEDVVKICKECERTCRRIISNRPPSLNNILTKLVSTIFANLPRNIFKNIDYHLKDFEVFQNNHNFQLIDKIIYLYLKIRLHHLNRSYNLQLKGVSVRQHLTKLVLFKHQ